MWRRLVRHIWLAPGLRRWLAGTLGVASEDALVSWFSFCLCLHDGKFAEAFQSQRADLFEHLRGRPPRTAYSERHDTLGRVAWTNVVEQTALDEAWLGPQTDEHLLGLNAWVRAVMGHHGQPPKSGNISPCHKIIRHDVVMDAKKRQLAERGLTRWQDWNDADKPIPTSLPSH